MCRLAGPVTAKVLHSIGFVSVVHPAVAQQQWRLGSDFKTIVWANGEEGGGE